jgi:IMP dehydrogenase
MLEGLSYDDVLLAPQQGVLEKRKDAILWSYATDDVEIAIPIISAPMPSVTEKKMAFAMLLAGGQAVVHRFQPLEDRIEQAFHEDRGEIRTAFIAIGLKDGMNAIEELRSVGMSYLCLDVAHGHHSQIGKFVQEIKDWWPTCQLMVGNVATSYGARFLAEAGADGIKVGIGPGAACRTREVTGFGVPQLTAIMRVKQELDHYGYTTPIIADGGIKNSGDIVKALAAGADSVMLGSLLAGSDEAPKPGVYFGNASSRVNGHRAPEGVEGVVPLTGPVENIIKELVWGIRSGISYGGARNIQELQQNAVWIRVAPGAALESSVRV